MRFGAQSTAVGHGLPYRTTYTRRTWPRTLFKITFDADVLKYAQTVRNLSERGGDWQAYDEALKSMLVMNGWGGTGSTGNIGSMRLSHNIFSTQRIRLPIVPFTARRDRDRHHERCCGIIKGRVLNDECHN